MRLTQWTDYSLRVLMYCAACQGRERAATIAEIARAHGISQHHVSKVVMTLSALGYVATTRGHGGGLRLLRPAADIVIGDVIRHTEADLALVECLRSKAGNCRLDGRCRLKGALQQAMSSFLAVLDGVTLADLVLQSPDAAATSTGVSIVRFAGIP